MSLIHEPYCARTYVIRGPHAREIYDILKQEKYENWMYLSDIMADAFGDKYYHANDRLDSEDKMGFELLENGDLEVLLEYECVFDPGSIFPFAMFLKWQYPDIDVRVYEESVSDVWLFSCEETVVMTNDPEGLKARKLDRDSFYERIVRSYKEEGIKSENGVYMVKDSPDKEWVPLTEGHHYELRLVTLERPTEPPTPWEREPYIYKPCLDEPVPVNNDGLPF